MCVCARVSVKGCVCACVCVCMVTQPADISFPPCTGGCQQKEDCLCTVELAIPLFLILQYLSLNVAVCMSATQCTVTSDSETVGTVLQ